MDKVRKLIRKILEQSVVSEAAKGFLHLGPSTGLVISKHSSDQIWMNLFNFQQMKCEGIITLRKLSSRAWMITTVAAEKGSGPILYEMGMMSVYPAGLCLDRFGDTSNDAFNVWKGLVDGRADIRKVIIKPDDAEYFDRYADDEAKAYLENVICLRTKSLWYSKMLDMGDKLMTQADISPLEINNICREYFMERYKER